MSEIVRALGALQLYDFTVLAYFAAFVLYGAHLIWIQKKAVALTATLVLWLAFALHTVFLVQRAVFYYYQHQGFVLPATNMFEAICFFVWLIVLLYLVTERFLKTRAFGVIAMLIPLAGMAYTARWISADPRELMPALKSYWLVFHVTAMFLSYAAFALAFAFALLFILRARGLIGLERIDPRLDLRFFDNSGYRLILFGFPVLTLGIFLGAVWADSAWGRYWGWDPKETWALITWLVYLAYLHLRHQWLWVGYRSALFNILGFVSVLVTFQGVGLLDQLFRLNSIHAYAEGGGILMLSLLALALLVPVALHFLPLPAEDLEPDAVHLRDFVPASEALQGEPRTAVKAGSAGPQPQLTLVGQLWCWLNSLPLAGGVMLLLAVLAALGTIIPQEHLAQPAAGMTLEQMYLARYGPQRYQLIHGLGLTHVYSSPYFFVLLLWLSLSALACALSRIRRTWQQWLAPPVKRAPDFFAAHRQAVLLEDLPPDAAERLSQDLAAQRFRVRRTAENGAVNLYADRGIARQWGLVLLHCSLIVLLGGAVYGKVYGVEGLVRLADGEQQTLRMDYARGKHPLVRPLLDRLGPESYELSQDHFRIDYDKRIALPASFADLPAELREYHSYFVKDFVSLLSVQRGGRSVTGEVKVNHPLRLGKLVFYQSGYLQTGYLSVEQDGRISEYQLIPDRWMALAPDGVLLLTDAGWAKLGPDGQLTQAEAGLVVSDHAFLCEQVKAGELYVQGESEGYLGPLSVVYITDQHDSDSTDRQLISPDRGFETRLGGTLATVHLSTRVDNYSDFSYKLDPGVPVLYFGWIALILGITLTLYLPFTRVSIRLQNGRALLLALTPGGARGARPFYLRWRRLLTR